MGNGSTKQKLVAAAVVGGLRFSHSHGWFFWSMRVGRCWVQSFSQNRTIHLTSLQTVLPCDELYPGLLSGIRGKPSLFGHRAGEDVWRIRRPGTPRKSVASLRQSGSLTKTYTWTYRVGLSTASSLLLAIFRLMGCVVAEGSLLILKPGEVAIWVIVKLEWVRHYDQLPERQSSADIIQSWDTACKEGGQNDYSVCSTWLYRDHKDYLVDVVRGRFD